MSVSRITTKAIVLRRVNYGEADRIIDLLTEKSGRVTVLAKGARRSRSRLAGGVEPYCINEISYIDSKKDIKVLAGSQMLSYCGDKLKSYQKIELASQPLKYATSSLDGQDLTDYYRIYSDWILGLKLNVELSTLRLWLELLDLEGLGINLSNIEPTEAYAFDKNKSSFIAEVGGAYTQDDIKLLRLASLGDKSDAIFRLNVDPQIVSRCLDLLNSQASSVV